MTGLRFLLVALFTLPTWTLLECKGQDIATAGPALFEQFCIDCHDTSTAEGGFGLRLDGTDWKEKSKLRSLELAHTMIHKEIMPPADMDQPSVAERKMLLDWLDQILVKNNAIGGTPLRRLSGREYANTVAQIFGLPDYSLPEGFPPDNAQHGFDNHGETLVLAASHLESLAEAATEIADQFFPPAQEPAPSKSYDIPASELVISYSSACLIGGSMRLASSGTNVVRHATWPTKFEAPASGLYEVEIRASSFVPRTSPGKVPELLVESSQMTGDVSRSHSFKIESDTKKTATFQIGFDIGATLQLRYANGPFNYEDKTSYAQFLAELFVREPELAAAWQHLGDPARGGSGWERLKEVIAQGEIEVTPLEAGSADLEKVVKAVSKNAVSSGETLVYKFFEEGPYIAIDHVRITGPLQHYDDRAQQQRERQRRKFMGKLAGSNDSSTLMGFFSEFLRSVFRRPATESEIKKYVRLATSEWEKSGSLDAGMHLSVRTALISPAFLYRSIGPGELSEFELASRLSYFLTSGPPDAELMQTAEAGVLSKPAELRRQARRLLANSSIFAQDFTRQWLGLDAVDRLMPDARLIRNFTAAHRRSMIEEVELTFRQILDSNQSVKNFIAPNFVFTDELIGRDIYQLPALKPTSKKAKQKTKQGMRKIAVDPTGRIGGVLGMPAIMMATANGVDTQPVLRGVWLLENVLGSPPPEPPKAVPALTPDIGGAKSPKARLAAHMSDASCAACHRDIDPLGFVLENFDPIGRWRETYPANGPNENGKPPNGLPIDATGTLPNGVRLTDVTDLKKYLVNNPTPFACCLSEKLMTYATGRSLNYRERKYVAGIVEAARSNELRFADLIVDLVDSPIFRTK
ncbi:MAG: DUF1592 domain-containing protein [Aureliella sp.]